LASVFEGLGVGNFEFDDEFGYGHVLGTPFPFGVFCREVFCFVISAEG
jgi:hypothetical protein